MDGKIALCVVLVHGAGVWFIFRTPRCFCVLRKEQRRGPVIHLPFTIGWFDDRSPLDGFPNPPASALPDAGKQKFGQGGHNTSMRKFLAILLAVLMTASLSVVGFAEEGIQPYGGGGGDDLAGDWILLPGVDTSIAYHTLDEFLDAIGPYTLPKTLQVGQTVQLKCYSVTDVWSDPRNITITPSTKRVTWVSGDTNILTVSSSGLVTAVGTGNWQDGAALGEIFEQGNQFASYSPRVLTTDYESDPTYDNCETGVLPIDSAPDTPLFLGDWPTMRIGDTVQLALFYKDRNDPNAVNQRYPGEVRWAVREMDVADRLITISNTGQIGRASCRERV